MATKTVTMPAKVHRQHMVVIPLHARAVLGIDIGDYVELTVRKLDPVRNEVKEPENKEPVQVAIL